MAHAVQALEDRRLAGDVIADRGLHARHVVGMHERAPVGRLPHVGLVVAEHGLPARREVDAVVERIEIPQAVVGAVERQLVALLEVAQMRLDLDALEARRETRADELHQQMQLHFPVVARPRAGDPEDPGRAPVDEVSDDEERADAEVRPHRRVLGLVGPRVPGIADLRYPQRGEARLEPRQRLQTLAPQLLRVAGGEEAARDLHLEERRRLGIEAHVERRVGARRLAQQLEIRGGCIRRRVSAVMV